ncbi:MAG: T9SS type A sorting domain-containing protein [Bacteroidota bacterium]|nr:T9SS type A sorting domain-containing protein [Bacteroidota bacterium]
MEKIYKPIYLFGICALFLFWTNGNAQVTILENAEQTDLSLEASATGTTNRSALAYNPLKGVYYSVNAGSGSYYVDSYSANGELLGSVVSGFDYRGAWWNPLLFTFEGNGYSSAGIYSRTIDPFTGAATAGGSIVAANTQPDVQSVGDLDTANYELIYHYDGNIFRYSRLDDQLQGSAVISGLPPGTVLNTWTAFYTGIEDMEYGMYDYANLRCVFLNRLSEYVGHSQLPATAFPASTVNITWANRLFWVFDADSTKWFSYEVLEGYPLGIQDRELDDSGSITIFPNPVLSETQVDFEYLNSEVSHIRLLSVNGALLKEFTNIPSKSITLNLEDESAGIYILQLTTTEGEDHYKKLIKK